MLGCPAQPIDRMVPVSDARTPLHTGGCQCGAVRYALYAEPTNPHVCHCRMCQKAFGNYFAPLAGLPLGDFAWTFGTPGVFKSSEAAERGFCRDCGTRCSFATLTATASRSRSAVWTIPPASCRPSSSASRVG